MTRHTLIILAATGSFFLLAGAYGFEFLGDMAPCKLCYWQRYPHMIAIAVGVLALMLHGRALPLLGAMAAFTSSGLGVYHTGVERMWWPGPSTCTSGPIGNLSAAELLDQIMAAPLVRCDDIAWELFGFSMASWNAAASFCLALLWIAAARCRG
ncbi:MAG: disulfide bond formation protein B [Paracoccaceae bacterium]